MDITKEVEQEFKKERVNELRKVEDVLTRKIKEEIVRKKFFDADRQKQEERAR